ncbi:hypothetical protein [Pedobacter sp.]|uniref:hypothetical protein n=1 Tax=Pedobacter sp. TaxID=1411316 RepID=UPI0031D76707
MLERSKMQKTNRTIQVLKIGVVLLFLSMLTIRIYVNLSLGIRIRDHEILWPLSFIFVTFYQSKVSWIYGICLFLYGLCYYFFEAPNASDLKDYEFTQPLSDLLYLDEDGYHTGYTFQRYLGAFPFLFYVVGLIAFLTNPIRRRYWVKNI